MEEEKMDASPQQGQKMPLESLTKEEIIQKYKGLLTIAKKAKQAKDEIFEENRNLKEQLRQHETQKESDENALMTMKEMLEAYTENKLQLTTRVTELEKLHKLDTKKLDEFAIENESLKRQLSRLTEDNESLLTDIENMEGQLKHVSNLSKEQKQQLVLQEKEIAQLKETDLQNHAIKQRNDELCLELQELKEKYKFIKDINSEQRHKFNSLKDRFIEVHKKLKKLKECKRILLETQHEYADAVSQWQNEIVNASNILCKELNDLREENMKLLLKIERNKANENAEHITISMQKLNDLWILSEKAKLDYINMHSENLKLKPNVGNKTSNPTALLLENYLRKLDEIWHLSKTASHEYNSVLKENKSFQEYDSAKSGFDNYIKSRKLQELEALCIKATEEHKNQSIELHMLKDNYEKLTNENYSYKKQLEELSIMQTSLQNYQKECGQLKEKLNLLEQEKTSLESRVQELEYIKQHNSRSTALESTKESTFLQQHLQNDPFELNKTAEENLALKEKVKEVENTTCSSEILLNLKQQLDAKQQLLEDWQQKYKNKEIEHCELLDEMRELNEALKARGDLISRQQEELQMLKVELSTNLEKLCEIQQEIDKKDVQLNAKQSKLETISQEVALAKQKLQTLENTNSLNEEKVRILSNELDNLKLSPTANSTDCDNQSDILSTSTISRADELQRFRDVEDSFEDKYNKLRGLAAKLKKKLQEETVLKQNLEKEIQNFKKQEKDLNSQLVELKSKITKIDTLHEQLNEKQKQIDALKMENHKLKTSRKQANVLNLEIEAAEKSLTEVTNKLANRSLELAAAEETIKGKDLTITQLRKEIELLESSKSSEIKHSQELKQQIDHLNTTLKDEMHSKQQACTKSKLLEQDVENLKLELENVKMELAQFTSSQETALKSLDNERQQLSLQLSTTQAALTECEQKLKKAERATEDLRVEYLDYKIKAQAVLRKNQNRDSSRERELEEELLTMRAAETRLNASIETLALKKESLEKERDLLNDDNVSLQRRCRELMTIIEDMRAQNEGLNQEIQQNIQQQHETLKQHRQQLESIDNCHKEQIESLNLAHQRQLEQLRKELAQQVRLPTTIGAAKSSNVSLHAHSYDHSYDQGKLDFLLMEREDAEGSEEAAETLANLAASRKISNDSSSAKRSMQDFIPLDELLNTPLNDITTETLITNSQQNRYVTDTVLNADNSSDFLQLELNSTKERLQKQESRVRHLTALLAENEQDLAKLTQMNDMLKEELRRQERSVEREQHMHNSEYVKNVIMKFLTLNNADEKYRLVPVLNTILKLSRSETEMLNCVAKGQKVSETTQRIGGWGNFLPWSNNSNNN